MRLLHEEPPSPWKNFLRGKTGKKALLFLVVILCLSCIPLGALLLGRTGIGGNPFDHPVGAKGALRDGAARFGRFFRSAATDVDIPRMKISMKKSAYRKITAKRKVSLGKPIFLTGPDDYVRAYIRVGEELSEVRIRLKGDWISQLRHSKKWSFRIEVKGDDCILGMKRFSIHHPNSRNYVGEWLFHRALKKEGIIALRYEFIDVSLNSRSLGIYALEEHFEKRLIENNRRREGPVIRFNEDLVWEDALLFHDAPRASNGTGSRNFRAGSIDAFNTSRILKDPVLFEQFKTAANLLEAVRLRKMKTSEAFNVELLAAYFALLDLFGGKHAISFLNLRFYYNPVTSLLEPVGFDANAGGRIAGLLGESSPLDFHEASVHHRFREDLFSDPVFFKAYIASLERVSAKAWLDDFFSETGDELEKNISILRSEFTGWSFSREVFYRNAEYIEKMLSASVNAVHAYLDDPEKPQSARLVLRAGNIQKLPVEVLGAGLKGSDFFVDFEGKGPTLQPRLTNVSYIPVEFTLPEEILNSGYSPGDFFLEYRIFGTGEAGRRRVEVYPWPFIDEDFVIDYFSEKKPNAQDFEFLRFDGEEREILIRPGEWTLDRDLVIPGGYLVRCGGGTQIRMTNGASLVSYSPLFLAGLPESPVVFSADSTGEGFLCLNTGKVSTLNNVIFENLSAPVRGGNRLTGAVTFYESGVEFHDCRFLGARSEDALNIVRSSFKLEQCLVRDAFSDGLDIDFGDGSIRKCFFNKTGNDAIDLAGSVVNIEDCMVENAGDKGLTVGENSEADVKNLDVTDSFIAVGCKDASSVTIDGLVVSDCRFGLAAYRKKAEFGPADLAVRNLSFDDTQQEFLVEEGSSITVDGEIPAGTVADALDLLYPDTR